MTIKDVRRQNLLTLIRETGSMAAVAKRCNTPEAYLSQIKNGTPLPSGTKRGVGDKLARKLEEGCGKPSGWMDAAHDGAIREEPGAYALPAKETQILEMYRQLPADQQDAIHALLTSMTWSSQKRPYVEPPIPRETEGESTAVAAKPPRRKQG